MTQLSLNTQQTFFSKHKHNINDYLINVQEGVRITLDNSDEIMNSKSEYHQPGVTRVVTTREVAERNTGR